MSRKKPARPLPARERQHDIEAMIRVDHAGEYGAVRIYEGQLAVLGARGSKASATPSGTWRSRNSAISKAFDTLVNERRVRPTALEPVWRVAGFALGAATALLGEKAAMACTAAVEEVIDEHYASQIARLGDKDPELKETVEDFRADEIAHRDHALAHGAEEAPGYRLLSEGIKAGCRLAIALVRENMSEDRHALLAAASRAAPRHGRRRAGCFRACSRPRSPTDPVFNWIARPGPRTGRRCSSNFSSGCSRRAPFRSAKCG